MTYQTFTDHFNNTPMTPVKDVTTESSTKDYFSTPEKPELPAGVNPHFGNLIQEEKERYHKSSDNLHVSL